jgi:hypothetical protein
MEQDKIKPVLEYLAKQWNEQQKTVTTTTTTTTAKPVTKKQQVKEEEQIQDKIEILHFDQPGDLKGRQSLFLFFICHFLWIFILVTLLPRVINVRPHILCCIVRHVDLATPGNLKKFLNLQVNFFVLIGILRLNNSHKKSIYLHIGTFLR